jgi:hypothetical protein
MVELLLLMRWKFEELASQDFSEALKKVRKCFPH